MASTSTDDQLQRCAILMMSLGEDAAAEVFRHLSAREVQMVGGAMASLSHVTRSDVDKVLEEFRQEADQFMAVTVGSDDYIRSVLTKALGNDRAAGLIEDILEASDNANGIDALNWIDANSVAELISDEHPQIIATILVHLERDRASAVLALLDERLRNDVVLRIATFGGVQPSALHELTDVLNDMLSGQGAKRSKMGGVRAAAELINYMSSADEDAVVANLRDLDPDLAQRIVDEMFVFDNLVDIEPSAIQLILKEIDTATLTIALKGAPEELRDTFMKNMSNRAADMLREDLEAQGPIRMSRVEEAQKTILQVARRLAEAGQFSLSRRGDDEYV
ncbi:flagellar motor switch protein FliG [Pusillimonas noertemannii]|uniref:Flagellar motor switch protein FliG n=1 Tax=Pusillimonas noertemannii TaxID=305977 RepID=A0A2U1CSM3_9BURK|nr:flagellar motor switch protein FliG [Pusillimonas noertemannii]NYT70592.1 flagellar motor switch protein FliG [Pusillimonas noertemannii]PVY68897.1 flagellar motor switch protein FliG [Pusillimonas noertemannii]TFL11652.1 flagellar motor switch protein FliG [Pusillimonas noertemannii]